MSQDRQSQVSERGEEFFDSNNQNEVLCSYELYEASTEPIGMTICDNLKDSILVGKQFVNILLKRTEEEIYEKYLQSHTSSYSITLSMLISERFFEMAMQTNDKEDNEYLKVEDLEDQEPARSTLESWLRSKIQTDQVNEIKKFNEEDELKESQDKNSISEKTSIAQNRLRQKKKEEQESQKDTVPKPFSMEIPQEQDEFIDRLRVIKQSESKRKEEKEAQEKKEKQLNPQELKKEIKNSKFAYDFDGKILNMKGVKIDRLPPSNYQVSFNFATQDVERRQKGKRLSQDESKNQKGSISQTPGGKEEGLGQIITNPSKLQANRSPFSYEDFIPTSGVTLYYQQKVKEGPKNNEIFENLANLDMRLKLNGQPLQITRSEYKRLTENGNLNMASSIKNMQDSMQKKQPRKESNLLQNNQNANQVTNKPISQHGSKRNLSLNTSSNNIPVHVPQSPNMEHSNFAKTTTNMKFMNNILSQHQDNISAVFDSSKISKITIFQQRLFKQVLLSNNDETTEEVESGGKMKLPQISETNQRYLNTPVDEFNQRIIKGGPEWGKGRQANGAQNNGLPFFKPNQKVLGATLQQFYKLPREREQRQQLKLSKSVNSLGKVIQNTDRLKSPKMEDILRGSFYTSSSKFSETLRSFKS